MYAGRSTAIAIMHPHEPVALTRCACDGRSRTLTATSGVDLRTIRAARFYKSPRRPILPWALSALSGMSGTNLQTCIRATTHRSNHQPAPAFFKADVPLMGLVVREWV
jgi:hypothetical protein